MKNQQDNANDLEINKKRVMSDELSGCEEEDEHFLALSLSFPAKDNQTPPPPPPPPPVQALLSQPPPCHQPPQLSPSHPLYMPPEPPLPPPPPPPQPTSTVVVAGVQTRLRVRRNRRKALPIDEVPAPFPWATTRRATVHSLDYLLSNQITVITGQVQCMKCKQRYDIEYDLREKFSKVGTFIIENRNTMHERAPVAWTNPFLPSCKICNKEDAVRPVLSEKKKSINWLFLLLGQLVGCCTLEQLKYFCKHTKNHRTGAKDRLVYLTYLGLCKQLDPNGPFDR